MLWWRERNHSQRGPALALEAERFNWKNALPETEPVSFEYGNALPHSLALHSKAKSNYDRRLAVNVRCVPTYKCRPFFRAEVQPEELQSRLWFASLAPRKSPREPKQENKQKEGSMLRIRDRHLQPRAADGTKDVLRKDVLRKDVLRIEDGLSRSPARIQSSRYTTTTTADEQCFL